MLQNLFFGNGQSRIQIGEPFAYGLVFRANHFGPMTSPVQSC